MSKPFYCTADEIARAVVTAARLTGYDPIKAVAGGGDVRARWFAIAALLSVFPDADCRAIGRGCGILDAMVLGDLPRSIRVRRRNRRWWDQSIVDQTTLALKAHRPEELPPFPFRKPCAKRVPRANVDITAAMMGDPTPSRSALAAKTACMQDTTRKG